MSRQYVKQWKAGITWPKAALSGESVDTYLRQSKAEFVRLREETRRKNPSLYAKLEGARLAAAYGRILLSHDRRTMPAHFLRFVDQQPSPGVILVPH